jgi:hypothetical protein
MQGPEYIYNDQCTKNTINSYYWLLDESLVIIISVAMGILLL